jgi:hypothetical protein
MRPSGRKAIDQGLKSLRCTLYSAIPDGFGTRVCPAKAGCSV